MRKGADIFSQKCQMVIFFFFFFSFLAPRPVAKDAKSHFSPFIEQISDEKWLYIEYLVILTYSHERIDYTEIYQKLTLKKIFGLSKTPFEILIFLKNLDLKISSKASGKVNAAFHST